MNWNRILSFIVALGYLFLVILKDVLDGRILLVFGYLIFSLGCIWFGDEIGDYVGIGNKGIFISSPTPGIFVRIMGWFFLIMPVAIPLITGLQ